jgi:hypothetical protein
VKVRMMASGFAISPRRWQLAGRPLNYHGSYPLATTLPTVAADGSSGGQEAVRQPGSSPDPKLYLHVTNTIRDHSMKPTVSP